MIRAGVWTIVFLFLLFAGGTFAHQGLHEQIEAVTKEIHEDSNNADLYLKRGELYRFHEEWNKSLHDYATALRLNPKLHVVEYCRGMLYSDQGNAVAARLHFNNFLASEPDHVGALLSRAKVLVRMKLYKEAVNDFNHAIAKASDPEPEYFIDRAQAVMAQGDAHLDEALSGLDEGIRRIGPIVTLQLPAIELELKRKSYDRALARIDTLASQSERKESWLLRRGQILKMAGRTNEAREAFQQALQAWESLPPHIKDTKAARELEIQIRRDLTQQ